MSEELQRLRAAATEFEAALSACSGRVDVTVESVPTMTLNGVEKYAYFIRMEQTQVIARCHFPSEDA